MRTMRILVLAGLTAALAFGGCTLYPPITGSGVLVEGTADFVDFSGVKVGYGFDVTVIENDDYGVTVTVDDNVLEHVRMECSGSTLAIGLDPWYSYRGVTLKAVIAMPVLRGVDLSGASKLLIVDGVGFPPVAALAATVSGASSLMMPAAAADSVTLELSGASTATLGLTAAAVRFEVSGASQLTAGGTVGSVAAEVSGGSTADLEALSGGNGDLEVSGGSRAWVTLSGLVDADISGASILYYRGGLTWGRVVVSGGSELRTY